MEALGAVAAVSQLLDLSIRTGKAAKDLGQSFLDAPADLARLKVKLDLLQSRIQQLHDVTKALPDTDLSFILPIEHQTIISMHLHANLQGLQLVKSLCNSDPGNPERFGSRLRWAILDKKKADRILVKVAEAESESDTVLAILGVRLACPDQTSLRELKTSHGLLHRKLEESTEAIKAWMHVEIQSLVAKPSDLIIVQKTVPSLSDAILDNPQQSRVRSQESANNASSTATTPPSKISRKSEIYGRIDPELQLVQHLTRKSQFQYFKSFGSLEEASKSDRFTTGVSLAFQSKRNRRKIRMILGVGFKMFCQYVLQFDLTVQQRNLRYWTSVPQAGCGLTVFNSRPSDAPVFRACRKWDLEEVRYLLESGQASVCDVDDLTGGLLEHVIQSEVTNWVERGIGEFESMQTMLEYLVDQGCDPNVFSGPMLRLRLPAILRAFLLGFSAPVSTLLSRGADLESFGPILTGLFLDVNAGFTWKMKLARTIGFSDREPELTVSSNFPDTILHGACQARNTEELLFALEVARLDPDLGANFGNRTPLMMAAVSNFLQGVAILIECGADVDGSGHSTHGISPLSCSLGGSGVYTDITQYLLRSNACIKSDSKSEDSLWQNLWEIICDEYRPKLTSWSFVHLVGDMAHTLLHGSDPFDFHIRSRASWRKRQFASKRQVLASEIARAWMDDIRLNIDSALQIDDWNHYFEAYEGVELLKHAIEWCYSGMIYQIRSEGDQENKDPSRAYGNFTCPKCHEKNWRCQAPSPTQLSEIVDEDNAPDSRNTDSQSNTNDHNVSDRNQYFRDQTQFYNHISTPLGREKLSRFPMVLAICDALQYAGYRAEMDLEGDIWYEDDDGDRYYDARETLPSDKELSVVDLCPICQDFPGHRLGHVLEEAEEAKRQLYDYREKVQAKKRCFY